MEFQPISKPGTWSVVPNLVDYDEECRSFTWESAARELDGLGDHRLNIAYEALDRHLGRATRHHLAIRWLGKHDEVRDFTYRDLAGLPEAVEPGRRRRLPRGRRLSGAIGSVEGGG